VIRYETQAPLSPAWLAETVRRVAENSGEWIGLVRYDAEDRWYCRLARDEEHEVWLLSWLPGQRTGFHDHGASAGAFAVARGSLREHAAPGGRPDRVGTTYPAGTVKAFGTHYVHDVTNASALPTVSVHAYSPPLATMRRFAVSPAGLLFTTGEEVIQ